MLFMNIKIEKYDLNLIIQAIYDLFGSFLINFEICENLHVEKESVHKNNSVLYSILDNNMSTNIKRLNIFEYFKNMIIWLKFKIKS